MTCPQPRFDAERRNWLSIHTTVIKEAIGGLHGTTSRSGLPIASPPEVVQVLRYLKSSLWMSI